jgi:hypothetical protein
MAATVHNREIDAQLAGQLPALLRPNVWIVIRVVYMDRSTIPSDLLPTEGPPDERRVDRIELRQSQLSQGIQKPERP